MKKLVLLVAVLTWVAFASGVMAQQTPAPKPSVPTPSAPGKAKVAKEEKFLGKVSSINVAARTVVVKGLVKDLVAEKTFTVEATTKITGGGKEIALADLKQGMNVSVSYRMEADKAMAAAITAILPRTTAAGGTATKNTVSAETPEK